MPSELTPFEQVLQAAQQQHLAEDDDKGKTWSAMREARREEHRDELGAFYHVDGRRKRHKKRRR